jgi:hypothetical protein
MPEMCMELISKMILAITAQINHRNGAVQRSVEAV